MNPFNWMLIGESHCSCRAHTRPFLLFYEESGEKREIGFSSRPFFTLRQSFRNCAEHTRYTRWWCCQPRVDAGTRARNLRFSDNVYFNANQHQTTSHRIAVLSCFCFFSSFVVLLLLLSWVKVIVVSGPHTPRAAHLLHTSMCCCCCVLCKSSEILRDKFPATHPPRSRKL